VDEVLDYAYCWTVGLGWLRWDGVRWRRTPDREVREKLRRWVIHSYEAAGREVAKALRRGDKDAAERLMAIEKAWYGVCSRARLAAVTDLASGIVLKDTASFDSHSDLLNCRNGVVDLRTGHLGPSDPDLNFTKVTGVDYAPNATHPDWDKAVRALPDEVADWMQVRLGQAATGYEADDDVIPICQGRGANGKSTLFSGVTRALGESYVLVSDRVILANRGDHPTELMELRGARFALIEELPEEHKLSMQRLKKITGVPDITARLIAKDSVTFAPTHGPPA
jgi:putative DNA primase/helicase